MRWEHLVGNDKIRYCGRCQLNVYNLAVMGKAEVENIFRTTKGRVCGRLYLRGDRTATLRECPQGRADKVRRRFLKAFAAVFVVVFALVCRNVARPDFSGFPQWVQTLVSWVEPEPPSRRTTVVGAICPPKSSGLVPIPTVGP
jgi:hypothetical protein